MLCAALNPVIERNGNYIDTVTKELFMCHGLILALCQNRTVSSMSKRELISLHLRTPLCQRLFLSAAGTRSDFSGGGSAALKQGAPRPRLVRCQCLCLSALSPRLLRPLPSEILPLRPCPRHAPCVIGLCERAALLPAATFLPMTRHGRGRAGSPGLRGALRGPGFQSEHRARASALG